MRRKRLVRFGGDELTFIGQLEEAGQLIREALASKPNLTVSRFLFQERYRDAALRWPLGRRLEEAGLPA